MDFRDYVRAQLPPLRVRREPEIVAELAEHLADLYEEARGEGVPHDAAVDRACAALPACIAEFAHDLETSADPLPRRIAYRWQHPIDERSSVAKGPSIMLSDLRTDVR